MTPKTNLSRSSFLTALGLSAALAACSSEAPVGAGGDGGGSSGSSSSSSSSSSSGGATTPELKFIGSEFDVLKGELPEGLAVTPDSKTAYVGFAPSGKIVAITLADGTVKDFGSVPSPPPKGGFAGGLALNAAGELYVTAITLNPANYKAAIYKIPAAGGPGELFAEDPGMTFPNGIAVAKDKTLLVTDSVSGTIFKISEDGKTVTKWSEDALIKGDAAPTNPCVSGLGFPFGANGIVIVKDTDVIVSNVDKASLVRIPIDESGNAGTAVVFASSDATTCAPLRGADGVAVDADGSIYLAGNSGNALVRISADGKMATKLIEKDKLDNPASPGLATLDGKKYLIVTNFSLHTVMSGEGTPHPGLLKYGPLP